MAKERQLEEWDCAGWVAMHVCQSKEKRKLADYNPLRRAVCKGNYSSWVNAMRRANLPDCMPEDEIKRRWEEIKRKLHERI